jgi:murein DD-endopeptidase MepM/ murein hydrolase activator NlpD
VDRIDSDTGSGRGAPVRAWSIAALTLSLVLSGCAIPRWPAEGPMTSPFGLRWSGVVPVVHRGVDIAMPTGTPVRAMAPGRVRFAGEMRGYGKVVWLDHPRGTLTVYAHLDEIRVTTGSPVSHRQVIGVSGATGIVTGPHLHFEVWVAGRPVDPVPYLGGPPR